MTHDQGRDIQILGEPLNPSELEEALSTDSEDRSFEDWDLIELAAEKWHSAFERAAADRSTGDVQAQAERPPNMRDNFSDDEIAAAFRDQKTLDRVLDALDIANTDQDPAELIVQMVGHIEELRRTKATSDAQNAELVAALEEIALRHEEFPEKRDGYGSMAVMIARAALAALAALKAAGEK